jgi:hypothetical protein
LPHPIRELDLGPETAGFPESASTTAAPSSGASALPTSISKPGGIGDPIPLAHRLTALWARMIDAPLEKIIEDDCRDQAQALLAEMNKAAVRPGDLDVMAAIRAVAVGLDLEPPVGAALRIYLKVLGELPLALLRESTQRIIETYVYPSFPKPGEWINRGADGLQLIERARLMCRIYEQRRRVAELYYGKILQERRATKARQAPAQEQPLDEDRFTLD